MRKILTNDQLTDFYKQLERPYWGQLRYLAGKYEVNEATLRKIKSRYIKKIVK